MVRLWSRAFERRAFLALCVCITIFSSKGNVERNCGQYVVKCDQYVYEANAVCAIFEGGGGVSWLLFVNAVNAPCSHLKCILPITDRKLQHTGVVESGNQKPVISLNEKKLKAEMVATPHFLFLQPNLPFSRRQ